MNKQDIEDDALIAAIVLATDETDANPLRGCLAIPDVPERVLKRLEKDGSTEVTITEEFRKRAFDAVYAVMQDMITKEIEEGDSKLLE